MEPYTAELASKFKLNSSDDWFRRRQALALPILPPTTLDARKYFFAQIRKFAVQASTTSPKTVDFEAFAKEWNSSADGQTLHYVTPDVLSSYSKTWDKISNIRASQDLIGQYGSGPSNWRTLFSTHPPLPESSKGIPTAPEPQRGVISLDSDNIIPQSISVGLAVSHPRFDFELAIPPGRSAVCAGQLSLDPSPRSGPEPSIRGNHDAENQDQDSGADGFQFDENNSPLGMLVFLHKFFTVKDLIPGLIKQGSFKFKRPATQCTHSRCINIHQPKNFDREAPTDRTRKPAQKSKCAGVGGVTTTPVQATAIFSIAQYPAQFHARNTGA
ncbi:hypothetical protein C8J57DRAFT_1248878 [Mycena rebaudengoi]|nr:hypothetical protein C8J57DRAFT_1248878 [Mycena rebaudengoi]